MKYTVSGRETGEWVVILHGWGATKEAMMPIGRGLENDWRVLIPDMYGFGETPHPPRALPQAEAPLRAKARPRAPLP